MARAGDTYTVELGEAHLDWGIHRNTSSRPPRQNERYLPIPSARAREFEVFNSNANGGTDILGKNIFNCTSKDGYLNVVLKAQGNQEAGDIYAKQFSVRGNLMGLSEWYRHIGARPGDSIRVTWTSPYDIVVEKI